LRQVIPQRSGAFARTMVWPLLPIVIEGLAAPTLSATGVCGAFALYRGRSPLWGVLVLPLVGAVCRVLRAVKGPPVGPAGKALREEYAARVKAASEAAKVPGPLRMFKKTASNTFRPNQIGGRLESKARLDLSELVHVLEVNVAEMWCDIEASATFDTFVAETLKVGVMPLVIPELRTITVGGAIVGIGVESSSFKNGFFHEGLLEADILVASGDVITVSPSNHADLFKAIPNSLGSFGYLLRLRMRVQPMKPFVELEKTWCNSPEELVQKLQVACEDPTADFVDGVALSDTGGMVMVGRMTSSPSKVRKYGLWPPFYPSIVKEGSDCLSTSDYLWRWDADWFWCTQIFPGLRSWLIRWLCGDAVLRSDNYKLFNDFVIKNVSGPLGLTKNEELIIQDIDVPVEKSAEWIRKFQVVVPSVRLGKIKLSRPGHGVTVPIWLCPVKGTASPLMPMKPGHLYINFGFWDALQGAETTGGMSVGNVNRALEKLCDELDAKKTLYSSVFFSEEEFYARYNGTEYHKIKKLYDSEGRLRGWYERLTRP